MKIKGIIVLMVTGLLTACSSMLTSSQNINQFYTLNAVDYNPSQKTSAQPSMSVETPILSKGLDSTKILLMHSPQRLDYYAKARWNEPLGKMLQTTLVESLQNTDALSRVGSDMENLNPEYALIVEVQNFQAEYSEGNQPPVIHIKMVGKLAKYPDRNLVASFSAEVKQQAQTKSLDEIVYTFDSAYGVAQEMLIDELTDYFSQ